MTSNSRHKNNNSGFTLIELIVVLLIISATVALVAPRVGSSWKRIEDSDFLQLFTETIQRTRLSAMNSGEPVAFRLNGKRRLFGITNPPDESIPVNVEIFSEHLQQDPETGDFLIIFYPDGSLVGNDIEVTFDHKRTFRIVIHPIFGTVTIVRLQQS
jgi:general secretion pathway protein H